MKIIHRIDSFLELLFPSIDIHNQDAIIDTITDYYTYASHKPTVTIECEWVIIDIDTAKISTQEQELRRVIALCEKGNYATAKPLLQKLLAQNPTHSETHRIMGQILSDEGKQDEAIDHLIDALRWDAKNGWALLMMGNIFAKFKGDVPTAMKYYDQALVVNPKDHITLTNTAAILLKHGKLDEATHRLQQSLTLDARYPNTHFELGEIAEKQNKLLDAFDYYTAVLTLCTTTHVLYKHAIGRAFDVAKTLVEQQSAAKMPTELRHRLEFEGDKEIHIVASSEVKTPAKIEFAENYQRNHHTVIYNPDYPAVEHLIMHELMHYRMVLDARKADENQIFFATAEHRANYFNSIKPTIDKLKKKQIPDDGIRNFTQGLFDGINLQIYNTPIDLFIESTLYTEYRALRPYQFISLYQLIQDGIVAVTSKETIDSTPAKLLSASKLLNLVNAMQFHALYGVDLISSFAATKKELLQATDLYTEFCEYNADKQHGEEYELIAHWAQDLGLSHYFGLEYENSFRKSSSIDSLLSSIESDPFGAKEPDRAKAREMNQFLDSQSELGTNMAVVMFMLDALQFFEHKPHAEVKQIAIEIAMQGTQGYNPDGRQYQLKTIPGKLFTGYHILAYYYVSWAIAIPESLAELNLPFDEEYAMAKEMARKK